MKEEMITFFIKNPHQFTAFCCYILADEPIFWNGHVLTNAETREIYTAMRKVFRGRNYD